MTDYKTGALFDEHDDSYRYRLWREWDANLPRICFIALNPSTADAETDDPTIRRMLAFARDIGGGALDVLNLFAIRSTDPRALLVHPQPIGRHNDDHIRDVAMGAYSGGGQVICAWGVHPGTLRGGRAAAVESMLRAGGIELHCLSRTATGAPAHPLYLSSKLRPVLWESRKAA